MTDPARKASREAVDATPAPGWLAAVRAAQGKQATDIVVLDLRDTGAFTDHFVICSGRHTRHVKAISDAVEAAVERSGARPRVEGYRQARWVLLDCFDFVVHVFAPETRSFYDLERLWGNASRVDVPPDETPSAAPPASG